MQQPMTVDELRYRFSAGEDALDLSIEKWDRLAQHVRAGLGIESVDFGWKSCGLCEEAGNTGLWDDSCKDKCRYYKHYGHTCFEGVQDAYVQFHEFVTDRAPPDVLACAAEEMRDELIAIKEAK